MQFAYPITKQREQSYQRLKVPNVTPHSIIKEFVENSVKNSIYFQWKFISNVTRELYQNKTSTRICFDNSIGNSD